MHAGTPQTPGHDPDESAFPFRMCRGKTGHTPACSFVLHIFIMISFYHTEPRCIYMLFSAQVFPDADKIIVLDEGRIVGMGTHETLLDSCMAYREIYNSQA